MNPLIKTKITYSEHSGMIYIERSQNVAPIIARNMSEASSAPGKGQRYQNDFTKVASIPNIVIEEWAKKGIDIFDIEHQKKINQMLNDPEYRKLRTNTGKV